METRGEFVRVIPVERDAAGEKLEPEERPATEATAMPIEVTVGSQAVAPGQGQAAGSLSGLVGIESTAGDVAQSVATRCELCAYFNREAYQRHITALAETIEGQKQIDRMRGELLGVQYRDEDGAFSIEAEDLLAVNHAIKRDFGLCEAFTESEGMPVAAAFYGGCPQDDQRFKPKDRSEQKRASEGFDKIMRMAQGRRE